MWATGLIQPLLIQSARIIRYSLGHFSLISKPARGTKVNLLGLKCQSGSPDLIVRKDRPEVIFIMLLL
jgi:hypothetical protein